MSRSYRTLPPKACELLQVIWRLEIELRPQGRGVTKIELVEAFQEDEGYIRKMIHEIRQLSDEYIVKQSYTPPESKGLPGRPHTSYNLNQERFVTWPETAFILLELLRYRPELIGRTDREEFVKHLIDGSGLEEFFIQDRIDWAIKCSYIDASHDRRYIYASERTFGEKDYLEFLKQAFLSSPSTNEKVG